MASQFFLQKRYAPFESNFDVSLPVNARSRGMSSAHAVNISAQRFRYVSSEMNFGMLKEFERTAQAYLDLVVLSSRDNRNVSA
jgi:hypothetical protein